MSVSSSPPNQAAAPSTSAAAKFVFFVMLFAMVFVQLFVTFRGLSSPAAMDSAQLARELAAGHGFHTNVVRPFAWRQHVTVIGDDPVAQLQDTMQPPLPALVLTPIFGLLHRHWDYTGKSRIYLLDRVTAAVSLFFYLGVMGLSYLTARRVFDARVAGWTAITMLLCQFLWDVARSGLAPMMALFFFSIALNRITAALERVADGEGGTAGQAFWIGIASALLVLTQGMTAWLLPGFVLAWMVWIKPRALALLILLPPLAALGGWGWWQMQQGSEPLSAAKTVLQAALAFSQDSWLWRDFTGAAPSVDMPFLLRKTAGNLIEQLRLLHDHLGGAVPTLLFLPALLHPFRRQETAAFRKVLAVLWTFAVIGMAFIGLPEKEHDDRQLHVLFIPLFAAYGFGFLAVLWTRLVTERTSWWSQHGAAAIAVVITALPMLNTLPVEAMVGLASNDRFAHWPPYLPDRIAKLRELTKDDEVIFTDAPWAVAWYADRTAIWLPLKSAQFTAMREQLRKHNETAAGLLLTPLSAKSDFPGDVFRGEYADWAAPIFRGYGIGLGVDTLGPLPDFPFKEFYPLAVQPVSDRIIAEMAFFADRKRWQ